MNTRVHLSNRCGSIILFCVSDFTVTLNEHKRASLRLHIRRRRSTTVTTHSSQWMVEESCVLSAKRNGDNGVFFLNRFKFHASAQLKNPDGSLVEMLLRWQSYLSLVMVDVLC